MMRILKIIAKYVYPTFSSISKLEYYRSIPKSIYFNLHYFPLKEAIKLNILVCHRVRLIKLEGKIILENPRFGGVKIGFGELSGFERRDCRTVLDIKGEIVFKGSVFIGNGNRFQIRGCLVLGNKISIVSDNIFRVINEVRIGDECMIGFTNLFMDSDFHNVINLADHSIANPSSPIIIGDHVWITSRCCLLKKSVIHDNSIVAANTVINSDIKESNVVISGVPGEVCKRNCSWNK